MTRDIKSDDAPVETQAPAKAREPTVQPVRTRWIVVHRDDTRHAPTGSDAPLDRGNPFATRVIASNDDEARAIVLARFPKHEVDAVINEDSEHQQPEDYRNGGTLTTVDIDQRNIDGSPRV